MSAKPLRLVTFPETALRLVESPDRVDVAGVPPRVRSYPELRYMGSKNRLLPWIHGVLSSLDFDTASDPFVGSGCVAYMLKCMGKRVAASDFLNFPATLATATIENNAHRIDGPALKRLLRPARGAPRFIERTFSGIFYTNEDLRFLDRISYNIEQLDHPHLQALARCSFGPA